MLTYILEKIKSKLRNNERKRKGSGCEAGRKSAQRGLVSVWEREAENMARPISDSKREMILNGNLVRAILTLAIPVMLNSFIQSMYNLTDTFWLGRIGTENQSAITLVSPFQNILTSFGNGITTAGAILISQYLGARKDEQAAKMANHICLISLGFSIICALLCFLISPSLVTWLGAVGNVYVYGLTYLRIVVLDLPFLFMINLFNHLK